MELYDNAILMAEQWEAVDRRIAIRGTHEPVKAPEPSATASLIRALCNEIHELSHSLDAHDAGLPERITATPALLEMLENPPAPNDALRSAFERHDREVDSRD